MEFVIQISGISLEIYQLSSSGKWSYYCPLLHLIGSCYENSELAIQAALSRLAQISSEIFSCSGGDDLSFITNEYEPEDTVPVEIEV